MSEQYDHLSDEDLEAIERIVDGGVDRQHGEHILGMVRGLNEKQPDPLLKLLERAHQAQAEPPRGPGKRSSGAA
jgi:hypothetical protein